MMSLSNSLYMMDFMRGSEQPEFCPVKNTFLKPASVKDMLSEIITRAGKNFGQFKRQFERAEMKIAVLQKDEDALSEYFEEQTENEFEMIRAEIELFQTEYKGILLRSQKKTLLEIEGLINDKVSTLRDQILISERKFSDLKNEVALRLINEKKQVDQEDQKADREDDRESMILEFDDECFSTNATATPNLYEAGSHLPTPLDLFCFNDKNDKPINNRTPPLWKPDAFSPIEEK